MKTTSARFDVLDNAERKHLAAMGIDLVPMFKRVRKNQLARKAERFQATGENRESCGLCVTIAKKLGV